MFLRGRKQRSEQFTQSGLREADVLLHPQAKIQRHLLVAASPGVELIRQRADPLAQLAEYEGVDIFFGSAREIFLACSSEVSREGIQGFDGARGLHLCEDAGTLERSGISP